MYDRFLKDPSSVAESWREFFADYQRSTLPPVATATTSPSVPVAQSAPLAIDTEATPLRGAAARIVSNMNASLAVPTATSVRTVAARLLEINRAALNESLARTSGAKVSFTHLIAFALVKGLGEIPAMNNTFVEAVDEKGTPGVRHNGHVGLGLAVDVQKKDGSRNLLVPVIRRRRHDGLSHVPARVRRARAQSSRRHLRRRRLRGGHRVDHQSRHARHGAVGAALDAGPRRHLWRGRTRLAGWLRSGGPTQLWPSSVSARS